VVAGLRIPVNSANVVTVAAACKRNATGCCYCEHHGRSDCKNFLGHRVSPTARGELTIDYRLRVYCGKRSEKRTCQNSSRIKIEKFAHSHGDENSQREQTYAVPEQGRLLGCRPTNTYSAAETPLKGRGSERSCRENQIMAARLRRRRPMRRLVSAGTTSTPPRRAPAACAGREFLRAQGRHGDCAPGTTLKFALGDEPPHYVPAFAGGRRHLLHPSFDRCGAGRQPLQAERRITLQKLPGLNVASLSASTSALTLPKVVSGLCLMPS
jgi:hypothetical protein